MSELDDMLQAAGAPPRGGADADDTTAVIAPRRPKKTAEKAPSDKSTAPDKTDKSAAADKAPAAPRPKADKYIIALYIALCIISIVELYSASSREVSSGSIFDPLIRHIIMMFVGVCICFMVSRVKIKHFVALTPLFVILSVAAMVYALFWGATINGANRSFSLAGITIQPAELLKISAVLIIAYIMSRNQEPGGVKTRGVVWSAVIVILFGGLLFTQGLTNTLLFMAISLAMMLIGGVQWKKFGVVLLFYGLIGGGAVLYKMHNSKDNDAAEQAAIVETGRDASGNKATTDRGSTWSGRFERYFNDSIPKYEQPITSQNRQEMYAYMAQANGGVLGVMPGNSRETARLPLAFSDYIFSIVVEDLGLIGGLFLLVIYLSLLARAGAIAARCDRAFPSMLVMGMAVMICFQALFHMAIVTGVFPVSGQPLPMISKGGTSMLVTSLTFGIMLSISRYAAGLKNNKGSKDDTADLPDQVDAANPTQISN